MTTLVIVESPGKIKKLAAILGDSYKIAASVGHVRDLPTREIGVQAPDFVPKYEPTERGREILAKLKGEIAKADRVILATDPDREGEAIAWHLADALGLKKPERTTFNSITAPVVQAAMKSTRTIDMALVRAQEARRVLDRLVGYQVSPALSDVAQEQLTAGRVQTPAVRLVVDRERAIQAFTSTKHYGAVLDFPGGWSAEWDTGPFLADGSEYLTDQGLAERVAALRAVTVSTFENTEAKKAPPAPFTTSTLQQAAGAKLKFKPKQTMELAQKLYELGAIVYHRTDSPNMSEEGMADVAAYANAAGLPLSPKRRTWKAKDGAQEGHEAIRPTHCADLDAGASDDERALYKLIWARAVASQLADAVYAVRSAKLTAELDGKPVEFTARGRTLVDPGWQAVYASDRDDGEEDEEQTSTNPIPALDVGTSATAENGRTLTKQTKPPARFTLPSLGKELEARGIGRPSTYAAILDNITSRGYIVEDKKGVLTPTPSGCKIIDALSGGFGFADLDYTSRLEQQLDEIAEGQADYVGVVAAANNQLAAELGKLTANIEIHPCPNCGKPMRKRNGANGAFWGCTGYPACKTSLPDAQGKPGVRPPRNDSTHACPKCSKPLTRLQGNTKTKPPKPYDFFRCSGYPICDAKYNVAADGSPALPAKPTT